VLLHAAHVVGGIILLALVARKAFRGGYDHEHHLGVHHAALYWHFLDIVWLVMFGTMLGLG
jgi:cytochrome c oxidase subunit 3